MTASILILVPRQGPTALRTGLAVESALPASAVALLINNGRTRRVKSAWLTGHSVIAILAPVPFMIGSASLLIGHGGGLGWIVAGTLGSILGAVYSAWIVLIEILR